MKIIRSNSYLVVTLRKVVFAREIDQLNYTIELLIRRTNYIPYY